MTVSKRTRFEVLRRDNYTCRYCRSTDGTLTVDHVTPVALGGTDDPGNLVAACRDCNAGKASSSLDAEQVADIKADAVRWSSAMQQAAAEASAHAESIPRDVAWFRDVYKDATFSSPDDGWQQTIHRFMDNGLTKELIERAVISAAWRMKQLPPRGPVPVLLRLLLVAHSRTSRPGRTDRGW